MHLRIHSTAFVGPEVRLQGDVTIGPYCVIQGKVTIGADTVVLAHSVVQGATLIGANCRIGPHAVIGMDPQHHRFDGRETFLVIEDNVVVREFATVHRATQTGEENATRVGRESLLMVGSHVAHDCQLGEHVTLANAVQLGGYVVIGDRAVLGGGAVIHQFVRIGRLAMIAGGEALGKDVMPFSAIIHDRHKGYNAVGCRRAGMDAETIHALRAAFRVIHSYHSPAQAARELRTDGYDSVPIVRELIEFIETSRRGIQPSAASRELMSSTD